MGDVTREEFDGLGKRVTELKESVVGCQSAKGVEIDHLKQMASDTKSDIGTVFNKIERVEVKVSTMWGKVTAGVAVAVLLIQIILRVLPF